jgi:predicted MFS family arabinose efflux permease
VVFFTCELLQRQPMFDLSLLRVPTFVGGLSTAFALSASLFALITYIVIYLQNLLHFSAIGTGVRLLSVTVAMFLTSAIAGRLTARLPARMIIVAGFALIGAGLLLMRGITTTTGWEHLLPGLIVAGAGAGLVNVALASTAVGVVHPSRAGMASGVNSTFRQIGIAAGIATFGTLLASDVRSVVVSGLRHTPLARASHHLAVVLSARSAGHAVAAGPPQFRGLLAHVTLRAFAFSLDRLFLIAAIVAFAGGLAALALIRQRDFVQAPAEGEAPGRAAADAEVARAA